MNPPRTSGQRAGLTRDAVLGAARAVLAAEGLDALTMRALARRLGVQPNTLYSHVKNKAALVEALLDDVLATVGSPAEPPDWRAGLHALMADTHAALLTHPDLVPLFLGRGSRGPEAQRLGDEVEALLASGGIDGVPAREALRILIVYTIGFAAFEVQPGFEEADATARRLQLAANFERGLEWLLEGIATAAR